MDFSLRKQKGYRNTYELDHRRVLIADDTSIQIFGYSQDQSVAPYPIIKYNM